MDGTNGTSALDAIQRPALPALPPDIRSSAMLDTTAPAQAPVPDVHAADPEVPSDAETVMTGAVAPATVAPTPDVSPVTAPIVPPPIPVEALASAPGSQVSVPATPPAAPAPVANAVPVPPIEEPAVTMDLGGMFPPTGEEIAAQMAAEQLEAEARKVAAKEALDADMESRMKTRKKSRIQDKPDLRPPGMSPIVRTALNGIAAFAVIGLLFLGYLFFQRIQAATRVTQLEAGECVDDFFSEVEGEFRNVFVVDTVNCAQPHAYEVFSVSTTVFDEVTDGYPGVERTFAIGQDFCRAEYDTFVGGDFVSSPWQVWTFVPTDARWDSGDRKVQCLVGDAAERNLVEGSLQGAGGE